jgi:phosphoadenosine phosphosulfate reductase
MQATMITDTLSDALAEASLERRISLIASLVPGRIVFTTSFGLEDQAITHAIADTGARIEILTLDTGRLFPETYELWSETEKRYGRRIPAVAPERPAVEAFVTERGINGFRNSVEARQACCAIRKVEPLGRALSGASAWITGLRAEQSRSRGGTPLVEVDRARGLMKINPLADWRREDLDAYIAINEIPYNPLHDRGFPSIGCAPCTRAVRIGEPERAGRWWWEQDARKECGLHVPHSSSPAAQDASAKKLIEELVP